MSERVYFRKLLIKFLDRLDCLLIANSIIIHQILTN